MVSIHFTLIVYRNLTNIYIHIYMYWPFSFIAKISKFKTQTDISSREHTVVCMYIAHTFILNLHFIISSVQTSQLECLFCFFLASVERYVISLSSLSSSKLMNFSDDNVSENEGNKKTENCSLKNHWVTFLRRARNDYLRHIQFLSEWAKTCPSSPFKTNFRISMLL